MLTFSCFDCYNSLGVTIRPSPKHFDYFIWGLLWFITVCIRSVVYKARNVNWEVGARLPFLPFPPIFVSSPFSLLPYGYLSPVPSLFLFSPFPFPSLPLELARPSKIQPGSAVSSQVGSGTELQSKLNLMHYICFKMWYLVATTLIILLTINWPNCQIYCSF